MFVIKIIFANNKFLIIFSQNYTQVLNVATVVFVKKNISLLAEQSIGLDIHVICFLVFKIILPLKMVK